MAKKVKDYFGLSWIVSLILAIIPPTSVVCGCITRFKENTLAGVIRLLFVLSMVGFAFMDKVPFIGFISFIIWIVDLVSMITKHQIFRAIGE